MQILTWYIHIIMLWCLNSLLAFEIIDFVFSLTSLNYFDNSIDQLIN